MHIPQPTEETLHSACLELIKQNQLSEGILRIAISRGVGGRGYRPPSKPSPTIIVETFPMPALSERPLTLWQSKWRKPPLNSLPLQSKIAQGMNSTLALIEAESHHADEALMLNSHGLICEAASANIFWQQGDKLFTTSLECGVLNGITRQLIIENWPDGPAIHIGSYLPEALETADAVVITNMAQGAQPIAKCNPYGWQWPQSTQLAFQINTLLKKLREIEVKNTQHA